MRIQTGEPVSGCRTATGARVKGTLSRFYRDGECLITDMDGGRFTVSTQSLKRTLAR